MSGLDPSKLRRAMDTAEVTPVELARSVDVSVQYVTDMRAGRRRLKRSPALRRRIADALGVPRRSIETAA